ncbi:MAG: cytotoxic translational repressor of toxin-antitoxin stability system [Gammaproteobacteria bacterium]
MKWQVIFTNKAAKQTRTIGKRAEAALRLLVEDLCHKGPAQFEWPHYGKLVTKKNIDCRHCHLIRGNPTFVCCWAVVDNTVKIIEIYYVGTHENAPY